MMPVSQDAEGLRQAALELLEEAFDAPERERNERIAEMAANPEALLDAMPARRSLSPGYYIWLGYVERAIARPLEAGITFREENLLADEVATLMIISEARARFGRLHPPCGGCGKPLADACSKKCGDCQRAEFEASARGGR